MFLSVPDEYQALVTQLTFALPHLLVMLVGIILAICSLRRHRKAAWMVLIALVVHMVLTIGWAFAYQELLNRFLNAEFDFEYDPVRFQRTMYYGGIVV
ncbi:MAG: hypothetical protein KC983_00210, partial [Phycisphaerales bacterium]|nr:hypothetical protein [Phycisphaerales bacterium]